MGAKKPPRDGAEAEPGLLSLLSRLGPGPRAAEQTEPPSPSGWQFSKAVSTGDTDHLLVDKCPEITNQVAEFLAKVLKEEEGRFYNLPQAGMLRRRCCRACELAMIALR